MERPLKPLVLLDIDGVINDLGSLNGFERPYGVDRIESHGFVVHIPDYMADLVLSIAERCEIYWCTTWRHNANDEIADYLELGPFPVVDDGSNTRHTSWKANAAYPLAEAALAEGRRVIWIEDFYGDVPVDQMPEGTEFLDTAANAAYPVLTPSDLFTVLPEASRPLIPTLVPATMRGVIRRRNEVASGREESVRGGERPTRHASTGYRWWGWEQMANSGPQEPAGAPCCDRRLDDVVVGYQGDLDHWRRVRSSRPGIAGAHNVIAQVQRLLEEFMAEFHREFPDELAYPEDAFGYSGETVDERNCPHQMALEMIEADLGIVQARLQNVYFSILGRWAT